MRRGLTMVEMLLALALLSALTLAIAAWLQVTVRTAHDYTPSAQWQSGADAVMRLVREDILIGDIEAGRSAAGVSIEAGVLAIRTRATPAAESGGPVIHRYVFDPVTNALSRERVGDGTSLGGRRERRLLGDVAAWEATLDPDRGDLEVRVSSTQGREVTRRFALP